MLVTMKDMLALCEAKKFAVGSFNTPNLESLRAVLGAAEELQVPVIVQFAEVHESLMPLDVMGPIMVDMAKKATVPVCVHLDHGETLRYLHRALALGFTSLMYDGSNLPYAENVANTCLAVAMAKETGASVEAEIGSMGRRESGSGEAAGPDPDKIYTDPAQAADFVKKTGIDALACSFGTTHGVYLTEPKLDFDVVRKVREATAGMPIVMHGGSGVSDEDFRKAIEAGVRKVNYYTYMALSGGAAVQAFVMHGTVPTVDGRPIAAVEKTADTPLMFHDIVSLSTAAMQENVKQAMRVFSMGQHL